MPGERGKDYKRVSVEIQIGCFGAWRLRMTYSDDMGLYALGGLA
jgi:hypothetical protein